MINAAPRHDIAALCRVASFTLDRLALRGLEDRDEVRLWLDGAARWSAAAASLSELAPATRALRRLRGSVHVGSPMSSMVSVCEGIRRQMSMADARPIPPPSAAPCTRAMVGLPISARVRSMPASLRASCRFSSTEASAARREEQIDWCLKARGFKKR